MTRPHLDWLYRVALRLTGQREAAEDLVQDTCLKAYRSFATVAEVSNYKAWLLRIMTNAHIDSIRRRTEISLSMLEQSEPGDGDDRSTADRGPSDQERAEHPWHAHTADADPEARFHGRVFLECVLRAIDRLAPDVRAVVVLAILEECRYDEIAEMLGCPVGTVRSRLSRGRQELRVALADYLPRDIDGRSPISKAASAAASGGKDD